MPNGIQCQSAYTGVGIEGAIGGDAGGIEGVGVYTDGQPCTGSRLWGASSRGWRGCRLSPSIRP